MDPRDEPEGDNRSSRPRWCDGRKRTVNAAISSRRIPDAGVRRAAGDEVEDERHHAALAVVGLQGLQHAGLRLEQRSEGCDGGQEVEAPRSEEHTSELQSLMRISYAVFCLK